MRTHVRKPRLYVCDSHEEIERKHRERIAADRIEMVAVIRKHGGSRLCVDIDMELGWKKGRAHAVATISQLGYFRLEPDAQGKNTHLFLRDGL